MSVLLQDARLLCWGGAVPAGVISARGAWTERRGLLLVLTDDEGRVGLGEATPLPGYSAEQVDEAEAALTGLDVTTLHALDAALTAPPAALLAALEALAAPLPPSARFALETAVLDLVGQQRGLPFTALIAPAVTPRAALRNTLAGRVGDPAAHARALADVERGARILKFKAGPDDALGGAAWLAALADAVGPEVRLRVDFGGTLPAAAVTPTLAALAAAGVEAVEEPTRPLGACRATALPWLADESLLDPAERDALLDNPACAGFVLKPTLLGGVAATLSLAARARRAGKPVTVTHAFEGPVALAAVAALALAVQAEVAGVDPHAALAAFPTATLAALDERSPLAVRPGRSPGLGLTLDPPPGGRVLWRR